MKMLFEAQFSPLILEERQGQRFRRIQSLNGSNWTASERRLLASTYQIPATRCLQASTEGMNLAAAGAVYFKAIGRSCYSGHPFLPTRAVSG
jgi:hypothetical protein